MVGAEEVGEGVDTVGDVGDAVGELGGMLEMAGTVRAAEAEVGEAFGVEVAAVAPAEVAGDPEEADTA